MTPDPILHAPESAKRPLPSRDDLARMLDSKGFQDAALPDGCGFMPTKRVQDAYRTADQLLAYFGHNQDALADPTPAPSGDEVAELRARVKMLEEALRPFAEAAHALYPPPRDQDEDVLGDYGPATDLKVGDLRRAFAALSQHQKGEGSHGE